ncbi:hypothetical protein [Streptomyces mutabilis]|uniref:hypothetical protein n=1 Tax=Streptomyces mutabilis TaxID=67332 RepID=UPI003987FE09
MSEESNLMSSLWPLAPSGATDWLLERCGDGITGFMPPAMPDAVWVLNAMYEHEQGPADVSYHEYHRARLTEGSAQPHVVAGIELDAVSVATGGGLGRAGHPGPGWRRLRWAELSHSHARAGPPAPARSTPARVRRFHHTTAPVAGDLDRAGSRPHPPVQAVGVPGRAEHQRTAAGPAQLGVPDTTVLVRHGDRLLEAQYVDQEAQRRLRVALRRQGSGRPDHRLVRLRRACLMAWRQIRRRRRSAPGYW